MKLTFCSEIFGCVFSWYFFKTASAMPRRAAATISAGETVPWKLYFLAAAHGYGQVTGLCVVGGMGR